MLEIQLLGRFLVSVDGTPIEEQRWSRKKAKVLVKLLALAPHKNIAVKISGACTLSHEKFPYRDIWDPLRRIFDTFSLDRCMWGTDWTRAVALLTYKEGVDAFRVTNRLSDADRAILMGGSLAKIYGWAPKKK